MTRIARLLAIALLALPVSLHAQKSKPATAPAGVPPGLDQYVDSVMKAFGVPGISLTIVKDGKVIVAKGYGVRRLGDPTPVDAGTLFGIASNTKVFTSLALGLLVERGKIEWDAPVTNYLPWFQMYDSWVTREITVRDLLVHRSGLGLGAGDLLWWPASDYTRAQIARQLKYIKPATSFRYSYAYDNVLYVVAGELIEAVSGQPWEEFVREQHPGAGGDDDELLALPDARPAQQPRVAPCGGGGHTQAGVARHQRRDEPGGWHHDQRHRRSEVAHDHGRLRPEVRRHVPLHHAHRPGPVDAGDHPRQQPAATRARAAPGQLPGLRAGPQHERLPGLQGGGAHRRAARDSCRR